MANTGPLLFNFALVDESGILAALGQMTQAMNVLTGRMDALVQAVQANTTLDIITTEAIMANFQPILDEITPLQDATTSLITLVQGIAAALAENADDPAEVAAIAATLNTETARIVQAVFENTPVVPDPEV